MTTLVPAAVRFLVLHCSDSEWGDVAAIDDWHRQRGFDLVGGHYCGYHFVILNGWRSYAEMKDKRRDPAGDGFIEPGRPECFWGAHALNFNQRSLGICLIGCRTFTDAQMAAARKLVGDLRRRYGIPVENVLGHYETFTEKPPPKTCPNFDMKAFRLSLAAP